MNSAKQSLFPAADSFSEQGSLIDHNYTAQQCMEFARRHGTSTDETTRTLAAFALHTGFAKQERLAGRIMSALRAESNAQASYQALPENCRW